MSNDMQAKHYTNRIVSLMNEYESITLDFVCPDFETAFWLASDARDLAKLSTLHLAIHNKVRGDLAA